MVYGITLGESSKALPSHLRRHAPDGKVLFTEPCEAVRSKTQGFWSVGAPRHKMFANMLPCGVIPGCRATKRIGNSAEWWEYGGNLGGGGGQGVFRGFEWMNNPKSSS